MRGRWTSGLCEAVRGLQGMAGNWIVVRYVRTTPFLLFFVLLIEYRHYARPNAGVEYTGLENAAPKCWGGKCGTGKYETKTHGWNIHYWKMRHQMQGWKMQYV